ncbi:MAG: hypothetical protein ACI94N_001344 [Candidatus Arcticimaribacter sp.]|jgi:hypothetical protein
MKITLLKKLPLLALLFLQIQLYAQDCSFFLPEQGAFLVYRIRINPKIGLIDINDHP